VSLCSAGTCDLPVNKPLKRREPGPSQDPGSRCARLVTVSYMRAGPPGSRGLIAWAAAWAMT